MEVLAALLFGGWLTFNSLATPGRVAKTAEKSLRQQFPGATVKVQITGNKGKDVLNGRFKTVRIEMANLTLATLPIQSARPASALGGSSSPLVEPIALSAAPAPVSSSASGVKEGRIDHLELELLNVHYIDLPIETMKVSFDDVRYDLGALKNRSQLRLIAFSNGRVALGVRAWALEPLVARRAPEVRRASLHLQRGEVVVRGEREVLGFQTPVEVRGPLVARGQDVEIQAPRARVGEVPLPSLAAAPFLRDLNPVFRFDPDASGPFRLRFDSIEADNDRLQVQGSLELR